MGESDSKLVVAATVGTLQEAETLRAILAASGIEAYVEGAITTAMMLHLALAPNWKRTRIMVRARDLEAAREALVPKDGITDEDWQAPPEPNDTPP